jgi:hypothetical protein
MLPMKDLRLQIGTALATTVPLDQASALNRVALVKAPFALDENLVLADLTLADFTGATAKVVALGAQGVAIDPLTGEQKITIVEPVGGWRWVTTALTNLPQVIYGYCLYDSTGPGPLLAVELLVQPVTLSAIGQQVQIGTVELTVNPSPLS